MNVGYGAGKNTRCSDRFVKYPYPAHMNSAYNKQYIQKPSLAKPHKDAFNLEKEAKIINPHHMDLQTITKQDYKGEKGVKVSPVKRETKLDERPT